MWYRIELNKDRSVRTCVEVSGSINEGRSVHYIESDSKESAIALLAKRYTNNYASGKASASARAKAAVESGRCTSCSAPSDGHRRCPPCRARNAVREKTLKSGGALLRSRHDTPEKKAEAWVKILEKNRAKRRGTPQATRAKQLRYEEVLAAFDSMTPKRFRAWLVARIAECQEKIDGKTATAEAAE